MGATLGDQGGDGALGQAFDELQAKAYGVGAPGDFAEGVAFVYVGTRSLMPNRRASST